VERAEGKRRAVIALGVLLTCCRCASALDPSLDINQYAHTAWTVREGFFKGTIEAISQTPDGYLWLGTEFGLFRFDGVRSVEWQPPAGERLPSSSILSLLTARDGRLWIGTTKGLASWKDGKLTHYPELAGQHVFALPLLEDREGTIWAGGYGIPTGRLCAIQGGSIHCYGEDGALGSIVGYLYEDSGGNLWVGAATGLWRWKPGSPKLYPMPGPLPGISGLVEDGTGALLIAMRGGIRRLVDGKSEAYPLSAGEQPSRLLRDRNGGLWIGTLDRGLLHVREGRTDRFAKSDGLSGDDVYRLFEDREGNVWGATSDGLDRFRDFPVPTISVKQGLSNASVASVLAARDGSIWLGTREGLNRWKDGQVTIYRKQSSGLPDDLVGSLFQDGRGRIWVSTYRGVAYFENGRFITISAVPGGFMHSIAGDSAGNIWISHSFAGLFHLLGGRVVERIPWAKLGSGDHALALFSDPGRGDLWLGFRGGGVKSFKDGLVRASYASADGLGEGAVFGLQVDRNGTLWAATEGGLSRVKNGRVATLTSKNGLPCDSVQWMVEDDAHWFWVYTACGLVRIARPELDAWASDPKRTIQVTVFDTSDGVRSRADVSGSNPGVAKSSDGKLWFLPGDGVSVIDPRHLTSNSAPPPVHIEQITADRKVYWTNSLGDSLGRSRPLPALTRDLEIDYTALSLVAPEKIRFRYQLEGYDRDWQDAGNRRQAFYDNLAPRKYRFRVIACNNSGVWNGAGDTLEFSIAPAYYQTKWFKAACVAGFLVLLGLGYELRMRQVQRESRQLRDVIETIPAYVWSALPDGSIDFINRRWLEFSGFSPDQALGWGWADALHPEDRARLVGAWRAAVASGDAMEEEARMCSADGQYRWLLFCIVPLRDRSGKIVKWYGKSMDIEDRKRAEQEREKLHQLESDLAHINRVSMMGELAASVAHEVNQPLTGIVNNGSACLRLLAGDTPDVEEVREAVGDMVRDGKRAGEVITRIRAMTKRATTPRERLDLNEVIREVLVLVGDEAKKRSVVIRTQFADDLAPVLGDRVQLQQVVLNLVMNAMEAMSSVGGRPRELVIHTRNVDGGQVQVMVEDSGVGLDPNTTSKIFEPFYTTKSSGMGMGLSICRSIVQNHGGRIWATANDGSGTRFHFTLPQYHREEQNARVTGV
jgi:PAS domain S-box-containing protein